MTTIMIVDDSSFLRRILKGFLSKNRFASIFPDGCRIIEAGEKAEALYRLKQERPDLVLLDIVMDTGERDGIEILDDVMHYAVPCKVIMMTAIGQDQIISECRDKGALGYVLKPFDEEQVIAVVESVLYPDRQTRIADALESSQI